MFQLEHAYHPGLSKLLVNLNGTCGRHEFGLTDPEGAIVAGGEL